ncbi:MAG: helix-turn-helix domain-containing protein [Myxococcales bacterium]|nr:helix-turn-helix domain-containing protein [Myxococcales bacterium]
MISLASNLRRLRRQAGLTQQDLADAAKIARATLASMERDGANPGLESVVAVAAALGVNLDELVSPAPAERVFKVTREEAREVRDESGGFVARVMSPVASRGVQVQQIQMAPGCDSHGRPHPLGAQEFFFTYRGTATVRVAEEDLTVEAGALVQFPGHLHHRYQNRSSSTQVEALSVVILA